MSRKQRQQPTLNVVTKISPQSAEVHSISAGNAYTSEERNRMVADAAYFHAERRGFASGNEMADWLEAENEIDSLIRAGGPRYAESV